MSANSKAADREEIRDLIRKGNKTSAIIGLGKWPVDMIKAVKSEELENDKKIAREADKQAVLDHNAAKRKKHHERFLDSLGITAKDPKELENVIPEEGNAENTTVVTAPAGEAVILPNDQAQA